MELKETHQQQGVVSRERIHATEHIIRPHIRRTPVIQIDGSDLSLGKITILLKLELFQHSGSFKTRGAFMNMLCREIPKAGVVAASGGNHGVAVAFAAMKLGKPAKIFLPSVASPSKIARIRQYGADLVITGTRYADALEASQTWIDQSGAMAIHAFDGVETMLGQGTVGLELEEQSPDLDSVLVAVGGGGLIGGLAAWYESRIKIVAVEPEAAPTLRNALRAGEPVDAPAGGIAADSLAPKRVGSLMFPIAQRYVQDSILVSDEEIANAQDVLWQSVRVVAEPGGAAALAALLSRRYVTKPGERVGIIVCGGNTEAVDFTLPGGRKTDDRVEPGQLATLVHKGKADVCLRQT